MKDGAPRFVHGSANPSAVLFAVERDVLRDRLTAAFALACRPPSGYSCK